MSTPKFICDRLTKCLTASLSCRSGILRSSLTSSLGRAPPTVASKATSAPGLSHPSKSTGTSWTAW